MAQNGSMIPVTKNTELSSRLRLLPTLVTCIAMVAGFSSVLTSIAAMVQGEGDWYRWSALLILLALILDGLDGNLARYLNTQSLIGAELDTFVDLTAFGIAPAVLVYAVTLQQAGLLQRMLIPCVVVLLGALRLSRFKAYDPSRGMGGYTGLPITANACWVLFYVLALVVPPAEGLSCRTEGLLLGGVLMLCSLQVSNVHYPATSKQAVYFIPVLVLALVIMALSFYHPAAARILSFLMLLSVIGYSLLLPLLKRREA